jgi:hypothetical protein
MTTKAFPPNVYHTSAEPLPYCCRALPSLLQVLITRIMIDIIVPFKFF